MTNATERPMPARRGWDLLVTARVLGVVHLAAFICYLELLRRYGGSFGVAMLIVMLLPFVPFIVLSLLPLMLRHRTAVGIAAGCYVAQVLPPLAWGVFLLFDSPRALWQPDVAWFAIPTVVMPMSILVLLFVHLNRELKRRNALSGATVS